MMKLNLPKIGMASGSVTIPGSKSISNRILLLAALTEGVTTITNLLQSDDTERMLEALSTLGINIIEKDSVARIFEVTGSCHGFPNKKASLFLGNAGTAFRSLTAAVALNQGEYQLTGISRMHERPIKDLVDALRTLGCKIEYLQNEGYPPLKIGKGDFKVNKVAIKGDVSSQYLTALLIALPLLQKEITIDIEGTLISKPYIEITLTLLRQFGIEIAHQDFHTFTIPAGGQFVTPGTFFVESDASSASYFLALGALAGPLMVKGVGTSSIQGDIRFADALMEMGADVKWGENEICVSKPQNGVLRGIDIDCNHIPDAAMTLAILAVFAKGKTILRNIGSWRVKETDRIAAMAIELTKVGVKVEEGDDYLVIYPQEEINPHIEIETYDDHRMAMCFSLLSLKAPITLLDPKCVDKTFPTYFELFKQITK